jgi:hypothetical protein
MGDALKSKVAAFVQSWDGRYGKPEAPVAAPPPSSADAAAVEAVAAKNAQIVAGVALGLHGPPGEGFEAARKLMQHFVDWNEVRVSRPKTLTAVLGKQPRAAERVALLQRFIETFFLRQRNLNLDYLFTLKPAEVKRFLTELQVFDREELAAMLLTGFHQAVFPPADPLREVAELAGLVPRRMTTLQMAKRFETSLDENLLYALYSHLYALANDPEREALLAKRKKRK